MRSTPQVRRTVNRPELDRLLREQSLSQADLARAMKLPESAVSNLLNGKRAIKDAELPGFAALLGVEIPAALDLLGIDTRSAA